MSLGKKILRLRLNARKTQRDISEVTGLAVSYLSRLENDHIVPSIPTLKKIADALGLQVTAFFDEQPVLEFGDRCPVSSSGRCILDQMLVGRGRLPRTKWEGYTPQQLEVIRLCDFLLHTGDKEITSSLSTMLESLFAYSTAKTRAARKKRGAGAKEGGNQPPEESQVSP